MKTIRQLLLWVQATFGIDMATAEQLVQTVGSELQGWFASLSRQAAQAAARAAGMLQSRRQCLCGAGGQYLPALRQRKSAAPRTPACGQRCPGRRAVCWLSARWQTGSSAATWAGRLWMPCWWAGNLRPHVDFGLEYAPLLAVLVGVTNIVPVLGPFLGAVPGIVILLLESPWKAAEFAIIILVVQQVDGNFIAPRILGGATDLPGLGVLLAIVVGGAWFGIPGMALSVPTLAVVWRRCSSRRWGRAGSPRPGRRCPRPGFPAHGQ